MENNQRIKCNVASCKFHNSDYCTLKEILVDSNNKATNKKETLCRSFVYNQEN